MQVVETRLGELLARIVRQCVEEGHAIELDGLGHFQRDGLAGLQFIAETAPRVFIAYADEDSPQALGLADDLTAAGLRPWIDKRNLRPGQNWRRTIERAIDCTDFFVPCFSERSVYKRGQFPQELRLALRCSDRMPLDDQFIVPVRLEPCAVPQRIQSSIQYVDLFPDWRAGVEKIIATIWSEFGSRLQRY